MSEGIAVHKVLINSIDCLRQPIADADMEIVQLGRGQLNGSLTKVLFPKLAYSRTDFSLPLRTSGILGTTNLTICMLLDSDGRSTSWARELHQGDCSFGARKESRRRVRRTHGSRRNFDPAGAIAAMFARRTWPRRRRLLDAEPSFYLRAAPSRSAIVAAGAGDRSVVRDGTALSATAAEFWQRCSDRGLYHDVRRHAAGGDTTIPSSLRIVREVEHYLTSISQRAVRMFGNLHHPRHVAPHVAPCVP